MALERALVDEVVEPLGQHFARDPKVGLELVEPIHPGLNVAQDQRRPRLPDDVEGARDGAGHLAEVRARTSVFGVKAPSRVSTTVTLRNTIGRLLLTAGGAFTGVSLPFRRAGYRAVRWLSSRRGRARVLPRRRSRCRPG
jgi:hypothetical protein